MLAVSIFSFAALKPFCISFITPLPAKIPIPTVPRNKPDVKDAPAITEASKLEASVAPTAISPIERAVKPIRANQPSLLPRLN